MTEDELKALEEKWDTRLKAKIYPDTSWLAEAVADLRAVMWAYRRERDPYYGTYTVDDSQRHAYTVSEERRHD